jgi:L-asparaginase II
MDSPVLVEATRGAMVESRHRGMAAVVDAAGGVVLSWGDIEAPVYARSALKPLQAMPLVESGAADAFGLGPREIALACGSHWGEPEHVAAVAAWLVRIGCGAQDLECGAHRPIGVAAADALVRSGEAPSALHSNCSGKHTGFLTAARFFGEATEGYVAPDHPSQRRWIALVGEMSGTDLARAPKGTDGCGIPVVGLPLKALARAMARMANPQGLGAAREAAARRILAAMQAEPLMVSGSAGLPTALMRAAGASLVVKPGAEGVYAAALPRLGLGVALKVEDGAGRAAEVALAAILLRVGGLDEAALAVLRAHAPAPLRNIAGAVIGELRPGPAFAGTRA